MIASRGPSTSRSSGSTGAPQSPRTEQECLPAGVQWVPDEEVNECPICHRAFATAWMRKHHCRLCGRVVCASCSGNQVFLPSHNSKQRVCDPCFAVQTHEQAATLSEDITNNRSAVRVLKGDLKEKNEQLARYRQLLQDMANSTAVLPGVEEDEGTDVAPDASAAGPAGVDADRSPAGGAVERRPSREPSEPAGDGSEPEEAPSAERQAMRELQDRARRRLVQVSSVVRQRRLGVEHLDREREELRRQSDERQAEVSELQRALRTVESELGSFAQVQDEHAFLAESTIALQQELEGLQGRAAALQASAVGGGNSFASALSLFSRGTGPAASRIERCRQAGGSCRLQ